MLPNHNHGTTVVELNPPEFSSFMRKDPTTGLHYHFVFCANTQTGALDLDRHEKFYRFIAGCVRLQQGNLEAIGGKSGGVDLLVSLNLGQNPADFIRKVKLLSASWAQRNLDLTDFAWHDEEVFTVSQSQCSQLVRRIERESRDFFWKKFSSPN